MIRAGLTLTVLFVAAGWTAAQPTPQKLPENAEKAKLVLADHVKDIKAEGGTIVWLDYKSLADAFPKQQFFALRFRIYPVAKKLPDGMKPSNIFVVEGDKARHIKDAKGLEEFFAAKLAPIKAGNTQGGMQAVSAWLVLSQEFVQDGFFKFKLDDMGNTGDNWYELRAVVMAGGNGDMTAKLRFDKDGKLGSVVEAAKIKAGPRPICQATKLLDADPIVRKMAEQDLLYMGPAAYEYMMEQRAAASPELQRAIDRVWAQIQKNGW
jgi:hypothetical protein